MSEQRYSRRSARVAASSAHSGRTSNCGSTAAGIVYVCRWELRRAYICIHICIYILWPVGQGWGRRRAGQGWPLSPHRNTYGDSLRAAAGLYILSGMSGQGWGRRSAQVAASSAHNGRTSDCGAACVAGIVYVCRWQLSRAYISIYIYIYIYIMACRAGLGPEERSGGCLERTQWPLF